MVRRPYPDPVTVAHDYSELHRLIDRLEPEQAAEIKEHALRLAGTDTGRFRVLRPSTDHRPTSVRGPSRPSGPRSARTMLIVDTGPLVAYLNRNDPDLPAAPRC